MHPSRTKSYVVFYMKLLDCKTIIIALSYFFCPQRANERISNAKVRKLLLIGVCLVRRPVTFAATQLPTSHGASCGPVCLCCNTPTIASTSSSTASCRAIFGATFGIFSRVSDGASCERRRIWRKTLWRPLLPAKAATRAVLGPRTTIWPRRWAPGKPRRCCARVAPEITHPPRISISTTRKRLRAPRPRITQPAVTTNCWCRWCIRSRHSCRPRLIPGQGSPMGNKPSTKCSMIELWIMFSRESPTTNSLVHVSNFVKYMQIKLHLSKILKRMSSFYWRFQRQMNCCSSATEWFAQLRFFWPTGLIVSIRWII